MTTGTSSYEVNKKGETPTVSGKSDKRMSIGAGKGPAPKPPVNQGLNARRGRAPYASGTDKSLGF